MGRKPSGKIEFWSFPELYNLELAIGINVQHSFPRHLHQVFCIGLIEEGKRNCFYRGSQHTILPGNVIVINPGEAHSCEAAEPHTYRMLCCPEHLLRLVLSGQGDTRQKAPFFPELIINEPTVFQSLLGLSALLLESKSTLEKESALLEFLAELVIKYSDNIEIAKNEQYFPVKLAKEYLEANFMEDLSLEQLARLVNLSPFHFLRVFSKQIGISPYLYQTKLRIKAAQNLLNQGMSLSQVACETGFVDQSHFTKVFKKIVGITPGKYNLNCSY